MESKHLQKPCRGFINAGFIRPLSGSKSFFESDSGRCVQHPAIICVPFRDISDTLVAINSPHLRSSALPLFQAVIFSYVLPEVPEHARRCSPLRSTLPTRSKSCKSSEAH